MNARIGIDPQVLGAVTGGNTAVADRIVERYMSVAGGEIDLLSDLETRQDRVALRRQAHRVVGAAATVGAVAVEGTARALEEAIVDGSEGPQLSSLIEQVSLAFKALADGSATGSEHAPGDAGDRTVERPSQP